MENQEIEKKMMSIVAEDGSIEEVEVILAFEFKDTKKEYVIYTKNEKDENENIIGKYRWNQLAGKRLKINSAKLYVTLESDNDSNVGYGFSISKIEKIPYSMLFGIH